jgi:hypothetical protein
MIFLVYFQYIKLNIIKASSGIRVWVNIKTAPDAFFEREIAASSADTLGTQAFVYTFLKEKLSYRVMAPNVYDESQVKHVVAVKHFWQFATVHA